MSMLTDIICISCIGAWALLLLYKWGAIEWIQVHGNDFFSRMAGCQFCLSWWVDVCICVTYAACTRQPEPLLYPFICTVLTRKLL